MYVVAPSSFEFDISKPCISQHHWFYVKSFTLECCNSYITYQRACASLMTLLISKVQHLRAMHLITFMKSTSVVDLFYFLCNHEILLFNCHWMNGWNFVDELVGQSNVFGEEVWANWEKKFSGIGQPNFKKTSWAAWSSSWPRWSGHDNWAMLPLLLLFFFSLGVATLLLLLLLFSLLLLLFSHCSYSFPVALTLTLLTWFSSFPWMK